MIRNPATLIFISPIRKHISRPEFVFQIVQPGGNPPLLLAYPTKRSAVVARDQIMRGQQAYMVTTFKLYEAISSALQVPHNTRQKPPPTDSQTDDQYEEIG